MLNSQPHHPEGLLSVLGKTDKQNNRHINILKAMAAGAVHADYLYYNFFKKKEGGMVSRKNFWKVINSIEKNGYIERDKYKGTPGSNKKIFVFTLTPLGANEVCNEFALERDYIHIGIPKQRNYTHELIVGEIVRLIYKEADEKGLYKLDYIYDDKIMKKKVPPKKGLFYPDLRAKLTAKSSSKPLLINIELDAGEKPKSYWMKKIKSWKDICLVIFLNSGRRDLFWDYISHTRVDAMVGLGVYNEFEKNGLAATQWLWMTDKGKTWARLKL